MERNGGALKVPMPRTLAPLVSWMFLTMRNEPRESERSGCSTRATGAPANPIALRWSSVPWRPMVRMKRLSGGGEGERSLLRYRLGWSRFGDALLKSNGESGEEGGDWPGRDGSCRGLSSVESPPRTESSGDCRGVSGRVSGDIMRGEWPNGLDRAGNLYVVVGVGALNLWDVSSGSSVVFRGEIS